MTDIAVGPTVERSSVPGSEVAPGREVPATLSGTTTPIPGLAVPPPSQRRPTSDPPAVAGPNVVHALRRQNAAAGKRGGAAFAALRRLEETADTRAREVMRLYAETAIGRRPGGQDTLRSLRDKQVEAVGKRDAKAGRVQTTSEMQKAVAAESPIGHPIEADVTVAVGIAIDSSGKLVKLVATNSGNGEAIVKTLLGSDEKFAEPSAEAVPAGEADPGLAPTFDPQMARYKSTVATFAHDPSAHLHAERIVVQAAKDRGLRLITVAASKDVCPNCARAIAAAEATVATDRRAGLASEATKPNIDTALDRVAEISPATKAGPVVETKRPAGAPGQEEATPAVGSDAARPEGAKPVTERVAPRGSGPSTVGEAQGGLNQVAEAPHALGGAVEGAGMAILGKMQQIIVAAEFERMQNDIAAVRPQLEDLRGHGEFVAVFVYVEVPEGVDLLGGVFTETADLPRYHFVSVAHGATRNDVQRPPPSVHAAPAKGHMLRCFQILEPAQQEPYVPYGHRVVTLPGEFVNHDRTLLMDFALNDGQPKVTIKSMRGPLRVLSAVSELGDDPRFEVRYMDDNGREVLSRLRFAPDGFAEDFIAAGATHGSASFWKQQ